MNIKKFFRRKEEDAPQEQTAQEPQPLSIEGISPALLTPEPDDAEIAAQALLEHLSEECRVKSKEFLAGQATKGRAATARGRHRRRKDTDPTPGPSPTKGGERLRDSKRRGDDSDAGTPQGTPLPSRGGAGVGSETPRDADYYRHLAAKMRAAREATRLRLTRFLAFCEQELKKPHLPAFGDGSLGLLEAELYKRLDIVEHEGGELLRRWQHCLALVTVRLMQATRTDSTETPEKETTTDDTD